MSLKVNNLIGFGPIKITPAVFIGQVSGTSISTLPAGAVAGDIAVYVLVYKRNGIGTVFSLTQYGSDGTDIFNGWSARCYATVLTPAHISTPPTAAAAQTPSMTCSVWRGGTGISLIEDRPDPSTVGSVSKSGFHTIWTGAGCAVGATWQVGWATKTADRTDGSFFRSVQGAGAAADYDQTPFQIVNGGSDGAGWVLGFSG